jgi:hypothetical protein
MFLSPRRQAASKTPAPAKPTKQPSAKTSATAAAPASAAPTSVPAVATTPAPSDS